VRGGCAIVANRRTPTHGCRAKVTFGAGASWSYAGAVSISAPPPLPRRRRLALAALALATAGCGAEEDRRPASWEYVSGVLLQPNCATVSCHSRATSAAGLDFSDPDSGHTSLVGLNTYVVEPKDSGKEATAGCLKAAGAIVCSRDHRPLVTPYNPDQSRLVHMLRARGARRMPPDRPLPEADIALVEAWILNGAKKDFGRQPNLLEPAR
jgi:hypothetical protein